MKNESNVQLSKVTGFVEEDMPDDEDEDDPYDGQYKEDNDYYQEQPVQSDVSNDMEFEQ